jgi:hypothetical protein
VLIEDVIDVVEINHFYSDNGDLIFDQLIYYRWSDPAERYQVVDWRLVKKSAQIPCHGIAIWLDDETLRRVRVRHGVRETWTQHDPELLERSLLPVEERRKLGR